MIHFILISDVSILPKIRDVDLCWTVEILVKERFHACSGYLNRKYLNEDDGGDDMLLGALYFPVARDCDL